MALLGVGALALMLGITYLGEAGASAASPLFIVPVVAGLLGLAWFGRHIRRAPDPFIAPVLIAGRGFGAVNGLGAGWSSPASRNACLQLVPDQSPALAALRSTGRQVGQIVAVSVTATIIAQPGSPGQLEARVFVAFALLLVACLPVIARVPEHRGSW